MVRNYLLPRFGEWPLSSIQTSEVKAMVSEELAEGRHSNSAVRHHFAVLSVISAAAVADGLIARNPCAGVGLPPEDSREMLGGLFPRLDEAIAEGLGGPLRESLAASVRPEPADVVRR